MVHRIQDYFLYLGQLVGKAALDGNLIDLPFSSVFYKLILSDEVKIDDLQVCVVSPELIYIGTVTNGR